MEKVFTSYLRTNVPFSHCNFCTDVPLLRTSPFTIRQPIARYYWLNFMRSAKRVLHSNKNLISEEKIRRRLRMKKYLFLIIVAIILIGPSPSKSEEFTEKDRERLIRLETKVEEGQKTLQRLLGACPRMRNSILVIQYIVVHYKAGPNMMWSKSLNSYSRTAS